MIIEIFEKINSTNSVREKEHVLKEHSNNEILKKLLLYGLNPYKLFYMNKIPSYKVNGENKIDFEEFFNLCDSLSSRKFVGNEAKDKVRLFLESTEEKHGKLFSKIITKSALGVGAKTVNKIWPKLVPEFKLMLAPNKIADLSKIYYPCAVQPKLDGYRCVYKSGKLWSRAGKPFNNVNLYKYFECLNKVSDYVLDGELYIHGLPFNKLTKILNSENEPIPKGLKYFVYDCVKEQDWNEQKSNTVYETRLSNLREIVNDTIADYNKVIDVATDVCELPAQVMKIYNDYLKKGYEGVMVKNLNGYYQWKRVSLNSAEMVKLKPFKTKDLEVIGIYEGEGNFKGLAGGLVVSNNGVSVRVGTGFDVSLREKMAKSPDDYIGKVVEVRYFEETEDGSLRHPSFVRFREEKD